LNVNEPLPCYAGTRPLQHKKVSQGLTHPHIKSAYANEGDLSL